MRTFEHSPCSAFPNWSVNRAIYRSFKRADARIRTADPIITSDVLYQLSYVGGPSESSEAKAGVRLPRCP
jgi:hypothetical protein